MLKTYLAVMCGGAVGTGLRMGLATFLDTHYARHFEGGRPFVLGTLAVNITGCFVIGLVAGLAALRGPVSPLFQQVVMVGILGGYTTFSAFGLQTFQLLTQGAWMRAALYVFLSFALCLLAVWLGHLSAAPFQQK